MTFKTNFEREFDMRQFYYAFLGLSFFLATSCLNQGGLPKIPGVDGPKLNVQNGQIVLAIGLENVSLPAGISMALPKMRHSSATITPAQFGGTLIKVAFDPRDVESDDFRVVPAETLPDGRPFPFTMDGTIPALALNVPKLLDTTFYVSNAVFGFFIPISMPDSMNIPFDIPFRLKINGKQVGIVSYIRENFDGEGSGVVLMLTMKQIQDNPDFQSLLKYSKRYESKVF
ncbi:MAG: hypothetical protein KC478_03425 [Bacteriovoracaceae bacterium]|nr:hypothetical protein [Bacteriovoracaceae bacterium]